VHRTHELYFGYRPADSHLPDCSRKGTGLMEVTRAVELDFHDEVTSERYRLACSKCGTAVFVAADGELDRESTHASRIGFGSPPERVGGLWLHPGPPLLRDDPHGPWEYLVTRDREQPREPGDVAGRIRRDLGPRGGISWQAGIGYSEAGLVTRTAGQQFPSKRAAVRWIAELDDSTEAVPS
jgi:hypothetical protein